MKKGRKVSFLLFCLIYFLKTPFFREFKHSCLKEPYSAEAVKERLDKFLKQQEKVFCQCKTFCQCRTFCQSENCVRRRKEKKAKTYKIRGEQIQGNHIFLF